MANIFVITVEEILAIKWSRNGAGRMIIHRQYYEESIADIQKQLEDVFWKGVKRETELHHKDLIDEIDSLKKDNEYLRNTVAKLKSQINKYKLIEWANGVNAKKGEK